VSLQTAPRPEASPQREVTLAVKGRDGKVRRLRWAQPNGKSLVEALVYAVEDLLADEEGLY
jgi:hypothetical protein